MNHIQNQHKISSFKRRFHHFKHKFLKFSKAGFYIENTHAFFELDEMEEPRKNAQNFDHIKFFKLQVKNIWKSGNNRKNM